MVDVANRVESWDITQELKVGDRVEALCTTDYADQNLKKGKCYTVCTVNSPKANEPGYVGLAEHGHKKGEWRPERFKKVEPEMEDFPYMFEVGDWVFCEQPEECSDFQQGDVLQIKQRGIDITHEGGYYRFTGRRAGNYGWRFRKATPEEIARVMDVAKKLRDTLKKTVTAFEEGAECPDPCCDGVIGFPPVEGCTCHISPPCGNCTSQELECSVCGMMEAGAKTYIATESEDPNGDMIDRDEIDNRPPLTRQASEKIRSDYVKQIQDAEDGKRLSNAINKTHLHPQAMWRV